MTKKETINKENIPTVPDLPQKLRELRSDEFFEVIVKRIGQSNLEVRKNRFCFDNLRIYVSGCEDWEYSY